MAMTDLSKQFKAADEAFRRPAKTRAVFKIPHHDGVSLMESLRWFRIGARCIIVGASSFYRVREVVRSIGQVISDDEIVPCDFFDARRGVQPGPVPSRRLDPIADVYVDVFQHANGTSGDAHDEIPNPILIVGVMYSAAVKRVSLDLYEEPSRGWHFVLPMKTRRPDSTSSGPGTLK